MCALVCSSKSTFERISDVLLEIGLKAVLIREGEDAFAMVPDAEVAFVEMSCPMENTARSVLTKSRIHTILLINQFQTGWMQVNDENVSGYIFLNVSQRELASRVKASLRLARRNARMEELV